MASLTKIMTSLVVLQLCSEYRINLNRTWLKVSNFAANITGTSAALIENQRVTINDLLYGLMLPSGNDAAIVLAEGFSEIIERKQLKR